MAYDSDIIITGGGLAGLALALAASRGGLACTIIEPLAPEAQLQDSFDGRTVALAHTARLMFGKLGLWQELGDRAGPIKDIRIVDGNSPSWLHYDHKDVGEHPMGYIVENRYVRRALLDAVAADPRITLLSPAAYASHEADTHGVTVKLADSKILRSRLLVAADGRNSPARTHAGIGARHTDYGQTAIVCTVRHEKHHNGVAIERFLPAGPFAILPMGKVEDDTPGHHSSLVWTERWALAPHYMNMNEADFHDAVAQRFGSHLGKLEVVGGRWSYKVSLTVADACTADRMVLVGDAAHAIHPIAGQGYNLGLRDVAALADILCETHANGLDIGGGMALEAYAQARCADSAMMIAATDALNRLFSNDILPVRLARRMGLAAVEQLPPLKKAFMRHAMGMRRHPAKLMEE